MEAKTLADAMAENWQVNAIVFTGGANTFEGSLLLAILKVPQRGCPKFGDAASLHPDGRIWSILTPSRGAPRRVPVCTRDELLSTLYRIITGAKLSDKHAAELLKLAQNWIEVDFTNEEFREAAMKAVATQIVLGKKS